MNLGKNEASSIGQGESDIAEESHRGPRSDPTELGDLLLAVWNHRYLIVAGTLLFALVGFVVSFLQDKTYEATSTMIVAPPAFSTELKPPALSVQSYRAISESPAILALVEEKLADIPTETFSALSFRTSIQPARQARNANFLPLIDLTVRASSPELAKRVANVWAEVASEEAAQLAERGGQDTLEFIVRQFPTTGDSLSQKEVLLRSREDHFDKASTELETKWRQRILNLENETAELRRDYAAETGELLLNWETETVRLLAQYRAETEALRLKFLDQWKPFLGQNELQLKSSKISAHQDDLLTTDLRLLSLKDRIQDLRAQLEQEPQVWVQSKAITDEALWQRIGEGSQGGLPESLQDARLRSESVSPVYQWLSQQLAQSEVEYATLDPRRDHLESEISRIQAEVDAVSSRITEAQVGLSSLTETRQYEYEQLEAKRKSGLKRLEEARQTGLQTLLASRENARRDLQAQRDLEVALLARESKVELARLTREIESAKKSYNLLATKYEEALLAKAEDTRDLKIGALAVLPRSAVSRRLLLNSAIAALAGLVLTLVAAFVWEYVRQNSGGRRWQDSR